MEFRMEMPFYEAILPWPVSVNALYKVRGKGLYISPKGRAFKKACGIIFAGTKMVYETERVWLDIEVHPPDNRRRDISNLIKIIEDALPWFKDDSQVDKISIIRCKKDHRKKGYIIIKCGAINGTDKVSVQ
jgi:Holliday junction resolvase RusA-like endonuclease|tara:strand:- start:451 stop:843 length:393 start_codon:yes stop_codon:yes gene_type:complete